MFASSRTSIRRTCTSRGRRRQPEFRGTTRRRLTTRMSRLPDGWHSSESRRNGAVDSEQRALSPEPVVAPTLEGAQRLGHEYWRAVMRSTLGLVRPRESRGGVELRVLGLPPALLALEPANVAVAHDRVA